MSEFDCTFLSIYRSVQQQTFPKIFSVLPNHEDPTGWRETVFEEDSKGCENLRRLEALSPFVAGGLLRVGGRLRNAALPYEARHSVRLLCNHPVIDLVIRYHHHKEGHMGVNHVLADINRTVLIEKVRAAVKRVLDTCSSCRFWKSSCGKQQMGDLPAHRVKETPQFRVIGTDFISPVLVKVGRSRAKRYICILTVWRRGQYTWRLFQLWIVTVFYKLAGDFAIAEA